MIDVKEIAKLVRKNSKVIIEKLNDGTYNVSNTYFMINLKRDEFRDFFAKFNSYSSTADIPFNFKGTICSKDGNDFEEIKLNTQAVVSQVGNATYDVYLTLFYRNIAPGLEARIVKVGPELGLFDRRYDFLLNLGSEYKSKGRTQPLYICNKDKVKACIMPIKNTNVNSLKEQFIELAGNKDLYEDIA
jgi:hypothetical protein